MNMSRLRVLLFCGLFAYVCGAAATIPGFYILGQLGSANTHAEATNANALSINSRVVLTGAISGGYLFNQNLAVEVGYIRFSNVDFSGVGMMPGQNVSLTERAIDFLAKPILPLSNNFNFYGKVGFAYFKADGSAIVNGIQYLGYSDSWNPVVGLGFSYDFTPNVLLDLAWTRIQNAGGNNSIPSADFYSVGLAYYFG